MLKKLSTAILSCSKKIFVVAATCVVRTAKFVVDLAKNTLNVLSEGWNWLGSKMRKPTPIGLMTSTPKKSSLISTAMDIAKKVFLQRFLLFIGGLICVYILPTDMTRGDLTWFENMLNVWKNTASNIFCSAKERLELWLSSLFNRKAVT